MKRTRFSLLAVLAFWGALAAGAEWASRALAPDPFGRVTTPVAAMAVSSLRAALATHRRAAPDARVSSWLALIAGFEAIEGDLECGAANELLDELFEALPPASDWPALDAAIRARATPLDHANPHWLVLSALGNYLCARPGPALADARHLSRAVSVLGWRAEWQAGVVLENARHLNDDLETDRDRIELEATHTEHRRKGRVTVPELYDRMDHTRARSVLERALLSRTPVEIHDAPRTLAAARRLALELMPRLRCAQFALARDLDQGELFDALSLRFPATPAECRSERGGFEHRDRMMAAGYRVAGLLQQGRDREARALAPYLPVATRGYRSELDGPAEALARVGDLVTLRKFEEFRTTLPSKESPDPGWDESNRMDAEIRERLVRGRVDEALVVMRAQLAVIAKRAARDDSAANAWAARAWRFVELGSLLSRPALVTEGLAAITKVPVNARLDAQSCSAPQRDVSTALVNQGHTELGLARARHRVTWSAANPRDPHRGPPDSQETLLALAGALHGAGRYREILPLLETAEGWLATDLADIVVEPAGDVPLGVVVARGLEELGRTALARDVSARVLRLQPECDAAYEVHARVGGTAVVTLLEELMRDNPLAVRPLIWRGLRHLADGDTARAASLLRRAVELDPLDRGQRGPGHLRAHRALAGLPGYSKELEPLLKAAELDVRARRLQDVGLTEQAIALQRSALGLAPTLVTLRLELARNLDELGQREIALAQYRWAFDDLIARGCSGCCRPAGCGASISLDEPLARFALAKALVPPNSSATAHYLRALLAAREGSPHDRARALEAALKLDPDHWPAVLALHELDRGGREIPGLYDADAVTRALLRLDPGRRHHTPAARLLRDPAAVWPALERAVAIERRRSGALLPIPRGRVRTDSWVRRDRPWTDPSAAFWSVASPVRGFSLTLRDLRQGPPGIAGRVMRRLGSR